MVFIRCSKGTAVRKMHKSLGKDRKVVHVENSEEKYVVVAVLRLPSSKKQFTM